MTLSSQDLTPEEVKKYKAIRKKHGSKVKKTREGIVKSAIGKGTNVSKAIAREIRVQILTDPKFKL